MLRKITKFVGGDPNKQTIGAYSEMVNYINGLEPEFEALSDEALRAKTGEFRSRLEQGESLDDLLPDAFAAVREASKRTVGLRHFDVQLMGGMALHQGKIAEMRTGEGKTLVATMPLYLNALEGKGAHLVTVNDYLARRDTRWMAPIYILLGLKVGVLQMGSSAEASRIAYIVNLEKDLRTRTKTSWTRCRGLKPIWQTLPTARTTNSVSIICVTTCACARGKRCSAGTTTPS